jgi:hypothetical protein
MTRFGEIAFMSLYSASAITRGDSTKNIRKNLEKQFRLLERFDCGSSAVAQTSFTDIGNVTLKHQPTMRQILQRILRNLRRFVGSCFSTVGTTLNRFMQIAVERRGASVALGTTRREL